MKNVMLLGLGLSFLSSCSLVSDKKDPGWEFAPQMYVSHAYEPYTQVENNTINKDGKNMREPVAGTIARSGVGYDNTRLELMNNYPIGKDSLEYAAQVLKNPLEANDKNLAKGEYFYNTYCAPCHGKEGKGDGLVGQKYGGVPNYQASYIVNQPSGHIYHVITKGKGRMWGHGSQIRPEERWQIVMYVNKLRGYTGRIKSMGHHHEVAVHEEKFVVPARLRNIAFGLMGIGLIAIATGLMTDSHRFWANFLLNNWYFLGVALMGTLFVATQSVTNAAWSSGFKRVPEAMSTFLPYAFAGFGIIILSVLMHWNHTYHWTHEGITDPTNPEYDPIIAAKAGYLNLPFMIGRVVVIFGLWYLFSRAIRKNSLAEDLQGGLHNLKRNKTLSAIFLPVFAVSWAMASWDFIMSIDTHWFSTIFWVYHFAAAWVTAISIMTLTVLLLRRAGYLSIVSEHHLHDLGKFMFAFSIFWTYIWLSQFLLIFYANIPEESIYYQERWEHFKGLFWLNLIINFVAPFLLLMTRGAKRSETMMMAVAVLLIIGKWIDLYVGIMPGAVGAHAHIGFIEIGMFLGFIGFFMFVVARSLTKASLVPVKHPYIKEFVTHEVL